MLHKGLGESVRFSDSWEKGEGGLLDPPSLYPDWGMSRQGRVVPGMASAAGGSTGLSLAAGSRALPAR